MYILMKRVIMCLKLLRNNMNLFVETSLSDLYICLFTKNFKVVDKIHVPNLAKKTDESFDSSVFRIVCPLLTNHINLKA